MEWWVLLAVILGLVALVYLLRPASDTECPPTYMLPFTPTTITQGRVLPTVDEGLNKMKRKKVIFAGLLRDGEKRIPSMIAKIEAVGKYWKDYRVVIVENDSTDRTRELLLEWRKYNPRVTVLGCGENVKTCKLQLPATPDHSWKPSRIRKMAHLRNIYMEYIQEKLFTWDYLFVIDMDIVGNLYIDGVADSVAQMENNKELDALASYGVAPRGNGWYFYDPFSHVEKGHSEIWNNAHEKLNHDAAVWLQSRYSYGDKLEYVRSSFGGATLYKLSKVISSRYDYAEDKYACEHVFFHKDLNMAINPSMWHMVFKN